MNENRPLDEGINMTELLQPSINDQSSPMTTTIDSGQGAWRDLALLVISIIGLVGNAIMIILFITVRRFRKPKNSFFIHHCTLDVVKSSFCIIFSRSLLTETYLSNCKMVGATYIVLVTTSAFNMTAMTINESYHFANHIANIHVGENPYCVMFGLSITWVTSIIINLGIAFVPDKSLPQKMIRHCAFMYRITGNYLLHVFWVAFVTFSFLGTAIYLRTYWLHINESTETKKIALAQSGGDATQANADRERVRRIMSTARRTFVLLILMVVLFILFWHPIFILTLVDQKFKVNQSIYRSLITLAWCHSSLTPIFFIVYNLDIFKGTLLELTRITRRNTHAANGNTNSSETVVASNQPSPRRPNTLDVEPAYRCEFHSQSGECHPGNYMLKSRKTCPSLSDINDSWMLGYLSETPHIDKLFSDDDSPNCDSPNLDSNSNQDQDSDLSRSTDGSQSSFHNTPSPQTATERMTSAPQREARLKICCSSSMPLTLSHAKAPQIYGSMANCNKLVSLVSLAGNQSKNLVASKTSHDWV